MGTIASVLQWSCTNCNIINPTESLKCLNCGTVRKVCSASTLSGTRKLTSNDQGSGSNHKIPAENKPTAVSTTEDDNKQKELLLTITNQAIKESEREETLVNR